MTMYLNFQDFLLLEECLETREVIKKVNVTNDILPDKINFPFKDLNSAILAKSVHAKWNANDKSDAIRDLTFEIKNGECYGICGSVGDGKVKVMS